MDASEEFQPGSIVKVKDAVERMQGTYLNDILASVNDHVVRVSVMTEPYFWHCHPESDETFLVLEGRLGVEFEDHEIVLGVSEMITVPKGAVHRTRPIGGRSVNLTVERRATTTERIDIADAGAARNA
jgi:mannose-6-phosphate isomerase-like protein (cupin superfamily)